MWASYLGSLPLSPRRFHPLPTYLQLSFSTLRVANPSFIVFLSGTDVTGSLNIAMSFLVSQLTMIFLPLLALLLSRDVRAQVTFVPPAVPLAVRSPYLNCWLQNATFGQTWPTSFNNSQVCQYLTGRGILISGFLCQILGWSVLVRVDGLTYSFLGDVLPNLYNGTVNFTSIAITPTQTAVTARAGPMQVNLTFLNPIEVRIHVSITFYVYIRIILSPEIGSSNPSHSHTWLSPRTPLTAQVTLCRYIQISAEVRPVVLRNPSLRLSLVTEWSSGDRSQTIQWSSTSNADVIFHLVTLQTPTVFTETINQAEWGTLYYAMKAVRDSYQTTFLLDLVVVYAGRKCHIPNRVGCLLSG